MRISKKAHGLLAVGALVLAGCASPTQNADSPKSRTSTNSHWPIVGKESDLKPITDFCGTKPMIVGFADGFGGNSWRKVTRAELEDEASKCDNIKKVIYTDAQADPQKAISDINGLVAQGVNALVVFADAGPAVLPAIKAAEAAGVRVVPFIVSPGGDPTVDYTGFVTEDVKAYGQGLARWTISQMKGKGNLVMLGGQPGNSYSQAVFDAVKAEAAKNPGIKLLNHDGFVVTNWEPGETQKVVAGLLTKYGQIDGIVSDYGGGSVGGVRAFQAAGAPLPVWSANDSNEFACLWYQNKADSPNYQIATLSSRTWMSRLALRKAVAAYQGIDDTEPDTVVLGISEDSTERVAPAPRCDKSLPPDAILSSQLSAEQLRQLFK
jgi:ribose transport system substrate-binding protein